MKKFKKAALFLALTLSLTTAAHPTAIAMGETEKKCSVIGAEYVPQNQKIEPFDQKVNVVNRSLSFILRIEKGYPGGAIRNLFLNFDAYKGQEKVSTMRLSDAWSNGDSRQSFSTYWGQYCNFDEDKTCRDFKPYVNFNPIGLNKDLTPSSINNAPYLLIFPGTHWELRYKSFQVPEHWDKYIKFYIKDRIYPDFRGYDFWIRRKCGEP